MENLEEKTTEAEMIPISEDIEDINDKTLVPISDPMEDINNTPSEIPNEIDPLPPILAYRRHGIIQCTIDSIITRENELNEVYHELGLVKEKYNFILSQREKLREAKIELSKKMANIDEWEHNIKKIKAEWDKIELVEIIVNEKKEQMKSLEKTKQIFQEVKSILEGNEAKLVQIKNSLGSVENRIADERSLEKNEIEMKISPEPFKNYKLKWEMSHPIVKKNNGIAWYISLKNKPNEFEFEIQLEYHEALMMRKKLLAESSKEVEDFSPEQEMKFEKELENGDKHDEITEKQTETLHLKVKKDLTLINNNLKSTHDLSVTNEATELVLVKKKEDENPTESSKEVEEFWTEQKIQLVEASENRENNDEIIEKATKKPDIEVKKDSPLVINNLKVAPDLSVANKVSNASPKPNQKELSLKKEEDIEDLFKLMDNLKLSD